MTKIKLISPIDGSTYIEREIATEQQAKAVIDAAKKAQKNWAALSIDERSKLVLAGIAKLGEMNDEIVIELAHQMGRPVRYGGEFSGVNERSTYMASIAKKALHPILIEKSENFERYIKREPHGLVLVIAPWNYPFMTAINSIVPALIAGNAIMLKHASQTLKVGERLEQAFVQAGVPKEVFQNIVLSHQTTSALIAGNNFDFINFTGSVGGGKAIEKAAAGTFTPLGLELGGKDPAYVMEDADLDMAVETLIDGAMFNSGQSCCGIERIYVCEKLFDEFIKKAVAIVSEYKLGNPLDKETTLGPLAAVRFANDVRSQIDEAIKQGATPLIDKSLFPQDDGGAYLAPEILINVNHDMAIMKQETFGPAVGIMKVSSDKEAIELMNDSEFGLTASLWTNNIERAKKIGEQIETGTIFMNRCDYIDPSLCWTGCKNTGRGGAMSIIGFHNLTRPKSYHLKKV